jgi:hypothetical protein
MIWKFENRLGALCLNLFWIIGQYGGLAVLSYAGEGNVIHPPQLHQARLSHCYSHVPFFESSLVLQGPAESSQRLHRFQPSPLETSYPALSTLHNFLQPVQAATLL